MDLSLIIPAYNEERRIGATLKRVLDYLQNRKESFEILVVDDGSVDNTQEVVKFFVEHYPRQVKLLSHTGNRGKGYSVKQGVAAAAGEVILFSDADLSTPIEEAEKLSRYLKENYDIAIGSRALPESQVIVHQPWYRENMGQFFNLLVQALIFPGIKDTQCGFKVYKNKVAKELFAQSQIEGFAFDVEILFLARKAHYRVKEVPVNWINSPQSKVHPLRDSARMFWELLKIRSRHK